MKPFPHKTDCRNPKDMTLIRTAIIIQNVEADEGDDNNIAVIEGMDEWKFEDLIEQKLVCNSCQVEVTNVKTEKQERQSYISWVDSWQAGCESCGGLDGVHFPRCDIMRRAPSEAPKTYPYPSNAELFAEQRKRERGEL